MNQWIHEQGGVIITRRLVDSEEKSLQELEEILVEVKSINEKLGLDGELVRVVEEKIANFNSDNLTKSEVDLLNATIKELHLDYHGIEAGTQGIVFHGGDGDGRFDNPVRSFKQLFDTLEGVVEFDGWVTIESNQVENMVRLDFNQSKITESRAKIVWEKV